MTAQHAAARRPWHDEITEVARSLRLAAAALAARLRALMAPALRIADSAGQAQDPAATPVQQPDAAPEPVPAGDDGAATLPLRAVAPAPPQGQPYADWPQPPLGALIIATSDGAVEYRRPDAIITVRATPGGGTSTEVWTPRRRQLDTVAWLDLRVVPRWYEAWLAEHPEAEVTAA